MNQHIMLLIFYLIFLVSIWQIHEWQHYKDFKNEGCEEIDYQIFRVKAVCYPDSQAAQLINERDEEVKVVLFLGTIYYLLINIIMLLL